MPDPEPAGSPVGVLLDPGDDVRVSVGLLERHDPGAGLVVVHPTPSVVSLAGAAHDVLGGLGRAVNRLNGEDLLGPDVAWRAVEAWLVSDQIEIVVVLRADRWRPRVWQRLLQVCRHTGARLLLVCHVQALPPDLDAVLAGTSYQVFTALEQATVILALTPPARGSSAVPALQDGDVVELPAYGYYYSGDYRQQAPGRIGPRGFLLTDVVYQRGLAAAMAWLATRPTTGRHPKPPVLPIADVQLFLARLVQDSLTRNHTLARLRGAQAGFRRHGYDLQLPSLKVGQLLGPGLPPLNGDRLDEHTVARIRAGVAHPVLAAGIALSLLTGLPTLLLHHIPWQALSPGNDVLHLTWFPPGAGLSLSTATEAGRTPITVVFAVPAPVQVLLRAARYFRPPQEHGSSFQRLFAAARFSPERLVAAAANCSIQLPNQGDRYSVPLITLRSMWQSHVTCTPTAFMGGQFDRQFAEDQAFTLSPVQIKIMKVAGQTSSTPQAYPDLWSA